MLVKSLSLRYKEASLRHALWPVLMRDFPWIMSITALKDFGYLEDCSVLEMDHLLVEMLQYKEHLAELFFFPNKKMLLYKQFHIARLPECICSYKNAGKKHEEP